MRGVLRPGGAFTARRAEDGQRRGGNIGTDPALAVRSSYFAASWDGRPDPPAGCADDGRAPNDGAVQPEDVPQRFKKWRLLFFFFFNSWVMPPPLG